jgi:hypothetical protein
MSDVLDQPVTHSITEIDGRKGMKALVQQTYVPPLDGNDDLYAEFDMTIARGIGELLNRHYFGYSWKSFADSKQGVVGFAIPELMGPTLHMVINLKQYSDLTPDLIVNKAGELLERMKLPRGQADMAMVAFARANRHKFDFGDVRQ